MDYKPYANASCEYDEFILRGFCSTNPSLSALQEVILMLLQELSHYLLNLYEFGAKNDQINDGIIEALSGIITNIDYDDDHFKELVINLAKNLGQAKGLYSKFCADSQTKCSFLKTFFKHIKKASVSDLIKKGEKHYISRNTEFSIEEKNLFDIIILLAKRICLKIIQIKSFNKDYESSFLTILKLLNALNFENFSVNEIKDLIEKSNEEYVNLSKRLYDAQEERYGKRESVYIPFSARNGKAILVSGVDMVELEMVLEATKDKGIDIYTHGLVMLMAHTLEKFRAYPHLVGHFGKGSDNSLFDFAAFPGAILMTRYLFQKVEYLYRGRLFTTDSFAPRGIIKIKDNNYEPIIHAALEAKGFTKEQQELIQRVGFRQKEMEEKVLDVIKKMEKNEIKHLYFIGILNHESEYKAYFDKFLEIMPQDCYAVSLSHDKNAENVLHVDSFYDYLFIYKIFEKFNEIKPMSEFNITIFITKCDQYTIPNIINFINLGIKNIYLGNCLPSLVNPAMFETLKKVFCIKSFTNPKDDLKDTLSD